MEVINFILVRFVCINVYPSNFVKFKISNLKFDSNSRDSK
jgi:hypothetical protein